MNKEAEMRPVVVTLDCRITLHDEVPVEELDRFATMPSNKWAEAMQDTLNSGGGGTAIVNVHTVKFKS
jgi:hypothetical protein